MSTYKGYLLKCPDCNSKLVNRFENMGIGYGRCENCGYIDVDYQFMFDKVSNEELKMEAETACSLMNFIKNMPESTQTTNLLFLCKTNNPVSKTFEKAARILAEYGVEVNKIVPCMMDLTTLLVTELGKED